MKKKLPSQKQIMTIIKLSIALSKNEWVEVTPDYINGLGDMYQKLPKVENAAGDTLYFNYPNRKAVYVRLLRDTFDELSKILD